MLKGGMSKSLFSSDIIINMEIKERKKTDKLLRKIKGDLFWVTEENEEGLERNES